MSFQGQIPVKDFMSFPSDQKPGWHFSLWLWLLKLIIQLLLLAVYMPCWPHWLHPIGCIPAGSVRIKGPLWMPKYFDQPPSANSQTQITLLLTENTSVKITGITAWFPSLNVTVTEPLTHFFVGSTSRVSMCCRVKSMLHKSCSSISSLTVKIRSD